jgi:dipeptide/tripeptide permease
LAAFYRYDQFKLLAAASAQLNLNQLAGDFQAISFGICNTLQPIFVGDQFQLSRPKDLRRSFTIMYFIFNVGELFGELTAPILRQDVSYEVAFVFCTCFVFLALVALCAGTSNYRFSVRSADTTSSDDDEVYSTFYHSFRHDLSDLKHIFALYIPMPMYWALFVQHNSTWIFQAQKMNRTFHGYVIPPDGKCFAFRFAFCSRTR